MFVVSLSVVHSVREAVLCTARFLKFLILIFEIRSLVNFQFSQNSESWFEFGNFSLVIYSIEIFENQAVHRWTESKNPQSHP